jgi:hypothetical protein
VPAKHCVHRRGRDTERPADDVRSFAKLISCTQDRLLDDLRRPPGRAQWTARTVRERLAASSAINPLGRRLPRAADTERCSGDGHAGGDQITDSLTLANRQDRIFMKIHKSPRLGRDSLTSRTLGGLAATSDRQQRVWELQLVGRLQASPTGR